MRPDFASGLWTSLLEFIFKFVLDNFLLDTTIQKHYVSLKSSTI